MEVGVKRMGEKKEEDRIGKKGKREVERGR